MKFARILLDGRPVPARIDGDVAVVQTAGPFDGGQDTSRSVALDRVQWAPPIIPNVFYAAGLNYKSHIEHAMETGYQAAKYPDRAEIGYRANNALTGHDCPVVRPSDFDGRLEYEGELVAVIGKTLRYASRQQARDAIFGWTVGNDVSAREWQRIDRTFWRSKNADTFKPMGPWIDTEAQPLDGQINVYLNGALHKTCPTGAMIFDPFDFIVAMTRYITLSPGDVIWMGTDCTGVMQIGDLCEVEVTGIGKLANRIMAENPLPHQKEI